MIVIIDNYDSFTYNLYQLVGTLTREPVRVFYNDALTAAELLALHPSGVVLSPGPGRPEAAGNMPAIITAITGRVPLLGVCLGEQAIAAAAGAQIVAAPQLMHGKPDTMTRRGPSQLLANTPTTFTAARYHSLVATALPATLAVTATSADGCVMAVEDAARKLYGVQFHPESIMTDPAVGRQIILNFLSVCQSTNEVQSNVN